MTSFLRAIHRYGRLLPTSLGAAGSYAQSTGAEIQYVSGPVSADWYSDLNDAITAAGAGGRVALSPNVSYVQTSPLHLIPGITIEGNRDTSAVTVTDATGIDVSTPASICDRVTLRNFRLIGGGTAAIGLDARGLTRATIEGIDISGFDTAGVWFGGDYPDYHSSWTNTLRSCEITAPTSGAGILFSGVTGTGASTANNISIANTVVFVANSATSIGIDLVDGDTNLFLHNDVGYSGGDGIPFRLGARAFYNTFFRNRTEDIDIAVRTVSGAAYNDFIANTLGSDSITDAPVELVSGTQYFMFVGNTYSATAPSPRVDVQSGATSHTVLDKSTDANPRPANIATATSGDSAFASRVTGDAYARFNILTGGGLSWTSSTTGAQQIYLRPSSAAGGVLGLADSQFWQLPKHAALPGASATRRGSVIRVEGGAGVADGLYVCEKDATDTYVWRAL